jgi:hypothetical protein
LGELVPGQGVPTAPEPAQTTPIFERIAVVACSGEGLLGS